nr:MAG TPA: hypothetical protein [Caudoviricetes sp.]
MRLVDVDELGVGRCSKDVLPAAYCAGWNGLLGLIEKAPTVDAVVVTRCKDCTHSTLPSELTQRYGEPGTLTCHNMHAPSNRRNVGSNDFCSYGEQKDGGADNA